MQHTQARAYTIQVCGVPPGPNARLHHMVRYRQWKGFSDDVAWQATALRLEQGLRQPFAQARVVATITQRSPRHLMDVDNAYSVCKPLVSALVGRLIVSDGPEHVTVEVRQVVGLERGVTLEVAELDANDLNDGDVLK